MTVKLIVKAETVLEMQCPVYVNVKKLLELIRFVTKLAEIQYQSHQFLQLVVS